MLASLTLPALAFLMGISGIPGLNALPGLKKAIRHKPQATAADSLPPRWKSASALAVEHDFLKPGLPPYGGPGVTLTIVPTLDPRRLRVRVDPDSGTYMNDVEVGDLRLGAGYRAPLSSFAATSMQRTFSQRWMERSRRDVNSLGTLTPASRTGVQFKLPVALPTPIQSLLGPGGPALNVSGAENIRISGTSNWTNQQTGLLGQRKSLFPSLDMQQDLDIRLEGQLSDRVKVNLLQNSANQVPLANRIAINYKGDEDDMVQALDLGNTSLSLPGTQYVSYSGRNEGLFGVKLATRFGPLDFTALASKQEGRSERATYSGGGASRTPQALADYDYVKGQYFMLYDPNPPNPSGQPSIYRIDDTSIQLYLDDGNYGNNINVLSGRAVVDPDRAMYGNRYEGSPSDTAGFRGKFDLLKPGPTADYEILSDYYLFGAYAYKIIRLRQPIVVTSNACLAVTYKATPVDVAGNVIGPDIQVGGRVIADVGPDSGYAVLKMLRVPRNKQEPQDAANTSTSRYAPNAPFEPVRELEMKNFYQLNGFGIDPTTFTMQIQKGRDDPPENFARLDTSLVSYIEVAGLDNVDESGATAVRGHDLKVDGTLNTGGSLKSSTRYFVDYKNGILFFPDPRPFAPRVAETAPYPYYFDRVMDFNANRRLRFDGPADSTNAANQDIYDKYSLQATDAKYYLALDYAAQRGGGEISLGKGSILEGTEVVSVNGERWTRDRDYTIDYDIGRLSLKRQLGPTDQLSVDYSYAPLFQQASKTLLGSAFRLEGRNRSLGGALLYESKGAQDLRPRLGEEPSRTLITDLNTEWRFRPSLLTRFVDALPGVRTTTPSEFNVQAEVGASFPNPNTRNEVFIDDMEGVRDAVSLSLSPLSWKYASPPRIADAGDIDINGVATISRSILSDTTQGRHLRNAEIRWYQPPNYVKEGELKPTLAEAQGAKNPHQVLALTVPKRPANALPSDKLWAGLTYPLDQVGIDLSRAQFIEVWVNDFRDQHVPGQTVPRIRGDHVKLHIDLGVVSEDQMRAPNRIPDGKLQSEDQVPRDRQLVVAGDKDEDTGYDGIKSEDERARVAAGLAVKADLSTASDLDPEGDDYKDPDDHWHDIDPRKFTFTNGSEGNKRLLPYPETEDLDLNELVDQDESYYEYSIALDDTSRYLATDVYQDFVGKPNLVTPVYPDNGWRRFRIPIHDDQRVQFGVPDLSIARHVRVWIEDLQKPDESQVAGENECRPLLLIGGIDIVGSRWLATELTKTQRESTLTTVTLNSVNSLDDAEVYQYPFDPGETRSGNQPLTRREQSMRLEFTELAPDDTVEAYRTFSLEENYSRYGALSWYATGFEIDNYANQPDDRLYYFVRFSTDEKGDNYYEVKRRVPASVRGDLKDWVNAPVRADLAAIANLKLNADYPKVAPFLYRVPYGADGDSIIIKGRPSFTRLRRISFGVINNTDASSGGPRTFRTGELWFDELRAVDVAKDVGYANRLLVNGRLANLMSYNVSWNSQDADFLSVGQTRGSGNRNTNLGVTSSVDLHRFFEGTGIQLPVSMSYTKNVSKPRFSAGDDVVRVGRQQELSETGSETRSYSTSYTRNWSQRANPLLRYTLAGLTANIGRSETNSHNPTGGGKTTGTNAGVNWNVAPRSLLQLGHKGIPFKIYPLPERVYWNYQVSQTKSESFTLAQDGSGRHVPSSSTEGRVAGLNFGADTRPVELLRHHIEGQRALSLTGVPLDRIGFVNLGRLTQWRQSFDASWAAQRGSAWLRPSLRWGSNYGQNNDLLSENLSVRAIQNGQTAQVNWTLPFDQLRGSSGVTRPYVPGNAGRSGSREGGARGGPSAPGRPGGPPSAAPGSVAPGPGAPGGVTPDSLARGPRLPGGIAPDSLARGPRLPGGVAPGEGPPGTGSPLETRNFAGATDSTGAVTGSGPGISPGAPPASPPADSGRVAPLRRPSLRLPGVRDLLARVGSVQTDLSINRSSSYSRVKGTPSPLYLLGLAENPGIEDSTGRVSAVNGNAVATGLDWRANGRTQVPLVFNSALSVRGSYGDRTTVANGVVARTRERRFPDLEVDYGRLADALRLTKILRTPQLRTGWGWSRSWEYQGDRKRQISQSSTHDLRPLISVRGNLRNGTTADLGVNMRSTYREVTQLGLSTQRDKNTDVNFTLTRSYSQGQKVNVFGKTSTVRSSVNMSLATVYSHRQGETRIAGVGVQNQVDETQLSVTGKGTYGFSTNVTGSAVLGYSGRTNHLQNIVRRSIRVELSAQFTF